ncbi:unnamed protein product [Ectocarpus sp. 4 AP-2014]
MAMAQKPGKLVLKALAALVPLMVLIGVSTSGNGMNGATSKAVDGAGRRLQTATYDFATQLEMTICLTEEHTTDSATSTTDQLKVAVMEIFEIESADDVVVDDSLTRCTVDNWQRRVSIYNRADETGSAADIASAQVDQIYPGALTTAFLDDIATSINAQDAELVFTGTDLDLLSLGFLVIWLDSNGDVVDNQGTTTSKDVVNIGGTDVWWPWWAWLIYAAVVLCCICPMLFFFFKWRRDKEAELDSYGGGSAGKDMGAPAPPSATSSNPYGGNYSAEEHKSGK